MYFLQRWLLLLFLLKTLVRIKLDFLQSSFAHKAEILFSLNGFVNNGGPL